MKFSEEKFNHDLVEFVRKYNTSHDDNFKLILAPENPSALQSRTHSAELRTFLPLNSTPCVRLLSIVYNKIYGCPQLFFNFYSENGQLIVIDKIRQALMTPDNENFWSFISQNEHPDKGIAFYNIHPCKTVEFFDELEENVDSNTILYWLSVFGAFLGLNLEAIAS
ncbi:unnamed protein product [Bursaphelenchus xylophilus]|uniref:Ubiquitin-like-conjugating enzyme ATG10 n=1 Tax=Bursaphelenchus xylophilus TaxID=6326 RepID=A0A1I7RWD8_BURXY|nr:unnamed protein product [Bursaphelenchus xylophilus]CAG9095511.1 unnamed protein product [Bursaphelenchus xylophilus]